MKSVLALDVSSSATGWAFGWPDAAPDSGVFRFKGETEDEIWVSALKWLNTTMTVLAPEIVAIEAPIMSSSPRGGSNPKTQMVLLGLQAVLRAVVKARVPGAAMLVNVSTARKAFTGRGTYPSGEAKAAVQAECIRRGWLDYEQMQADRADALCVWACAAAQQNSALQFSKANSRRAA